MKKILIFTHEFPPRLGGAGGVALQLAEFLTHKKHDVTVITEKRIHSFNHTFKLIEIPTIDKLWFLSYLFFFKFHNLDQYDKIIINDGGAIYSAGLSFNDKILAKSIIYVHGEEKYLSQNTFILKIMHFKRYYLRALDRSYKIISVSNFIKDLFFRLELKKFLPKVQTIYNGVDTKQFYYLPNKKMQDFKVADDEIILISISRFIKQKGYLTKLRIFKKLLEKNKNYKWFIIGDGDFKNKFQELIAKDKLESKIFLLGKKERIELKYYLSRSHFFWLLSDLEESYGLVYLEAMACKCIPIGWNRAGVQEVIKNNINGCLANTESEVIEFIQNGYKKINRESLPSTVIKIEGNYNKVID